MAGPGKVDRPVFGTVCRKIASSPYFFWALLALPSIQLLLTLEEGRGQQGASAVHEVVGISGVLATVLMLIALSLSPLRSMFPNARGVGSLLRRRRYIGVAAFCYSVVHLVFYLLDVGTAGEVFAEFAAPGILTGWVALFIFVPLTLTSNAVMTRALGWRHWKMLQRGIYAAAVLVMAHWIVVEGEPEPLIFFAVVALLECYRLWRKLAERDSREAFADPGSA